MTTIVTIDMGGTGATHAAGAREALSVPSMTDMGQSYAQANAAYSQANTARNTANDAYGQANVAYGQANNARSDANTTFLTINTTFGTVNTSLSTMNLNLSGAQAWSNIVSFAAYAQANTARSDANTTFATINTTFSTVNTNYQAAYSQANLAYAAANNSNLLSGGLVSGTLNVTQDLIVGGNIYLEGNTTYINVATYSIEDSLVYYASNNKLTDSVDIGFMGGKNTGGTYAHTGLARDATDGKWKLFDGLAEEGHVGNVVDFANTYLATLVANVEANTLTVVNGISGNVNFDSGTLFVDSVGNKVGIGTTSPGAKVQIDGNSDTSDEDCMLRIVDSDTTSGSQIPAIQFLGGASANQIGLLRVNDQLGFQFRNNANSTIATFNQDGNVGIGTTSPTHKLQTNGSGRFGTMTTGPGLLSGSSDTFQVGLNQDNTNTTNTQVWAEYVNGATSASWAIRYRAANDTGTASTRLYLDAASGNLGIGTTSPTDTLGYGRALDIQSNAGAAVYLRDSDNTGEYTSLGYEGGSAKNFSIFNAAAGDVRIYTSGSQRLTVNSSGNVGIGTTNPQAVLDLGGGTNGRGITWGGSTGVNQYATIWTEYSSGSLILGAGVEGSTSASSFLYSYTGTIAAAAIELDSFSSDGIKFYTDSAAARTAGTVATMSERMRISQSGNVGIGTTSPGSKLDVFGGIRSTTSSTTGTALIEALNDLGTMVLQTGLFGSTKSGTTFGLNNANLAFMYTTTYSSGHPSALAIGTSSSQPLVFGTGATERMRIDGSGNVGIGTTSPQNLFHVSGTNQSVRFSNFGVDRNGLIISYQNQNTHGLHLTYTPNDATAYIENTYQANAGTVYGDIYFRQNVAGTMTTRMTIKADGGYVGIGTASPGVELDVKRTTNAYPLRVGSEGGQGRVIVYADVAATPSKYNWIAGAQYNLDNGYEITPSTAVGGYTFSTPALVINSSRNVGIGTTSPQAKLHVQGSEILVNVSDDWQQSSGGTTLIRGGILSGTISNDINAIKIFPATSSRSLGYYNSGISFMHLDPENSTWGTSYTGAHAWIGMRITSAAGQELDALVFATNSSTTAGTHPTEKMCILPDGNVGIGTTSPGYKLDVNGDTRLLAGGILRLQTSTGTERGGIQALESTGAGGAGLVINTSGGEEIVFKDSSDINMVIKGTGSVGIGTTSPGSYKLYVSGDQYVSGTLTEASSISLKENINPINNALDLVASLVGVTYDRKDGSAKHRAGLIAEEVELVLPNVVQKDDNGNPSGIQYTNLIAYLVESIKELKAEIDVLKSK